MNEVLLIDTDVLIDFLRHRGEALAYLKSRTGRLLISAITVAELYAGVCEGRETTELEVLVAVLEVVPVDQETARMGGDYRRLYRKSHNLGLSDTLIAASAVKANATLVTLNRKHFPMLPDLVVPYTKPQV